MCMDRDLYDNIVYKRQILTYKDGPRTDTTTLFIMAIDL